MRKVLCLGNAVYDMTMVANEFPKENLKYRVKNLIRCPGGSAANAAYLLGKWGIDTYFGGAIGDDLYGKLIMDDFKKVNVKTKYVSVDDDHDTPLSFIVASKDKGSRTIFSYRDEDLLMEQMEYDEDFDYILVDGRDAEEVKRVFKKYPKAVKIMDASRVTKGDIEIASMVDYLVCSLHFASLIVGHEIDVNNRKELISSFKKIETLFKNHVVITLESHGSIYRDDKGVRLMPSYQMKNVVDTTGAGDIFHGAFTYALIKGYDYEDVIRIATIAAALSVRRVGGRNSIVNIDEVMMLYEKSR